MMFFLFYKNRQLAFSYPTAHFCYFFIILLCFYGHFIQVPDFIYILLDGTV